MVLLFVEGVLLCLRVSQGSWPGAFFCVLYFYLKTCTNEKYIAWALGLGVLVDCFHTFTFVLSLACILASLAPASLELY